LKDSYLTPTAILTGAQGLTTARRLVANGADKARAAVLTTRMDAAKMLVYLVLLFRREEMMNISAATGMPWPLEEQTLHTAYNEYARAFNMLGMSFGTWANNGCCSVGTAFYKLVFDRTTAEA
jgi:hypothetical protein